MKHPSAAHPGRRLIALTLALALAAGLLPGTATAAQTGSSGASRTVFDALGFDTGAPAGYEQEKGIADTPFGRTYSTLAAVDELFTVNTKDKTAKLFGHQKPAGGAVSSFFSGEKTASGVQCPDALASRAFEGNFSAENGGQKKNVAMLSIERRTEDGAADCYWRLTTSDASGKTGTILDTAMTPGTRPVEGVSAAWAYTQFDLAVGDFDGDGIDEIAVARPGLRGNRGYLSVDVYKLQKTDGDSCLSAANWNLATHYDSAELGKGRVNMISLAAADINKDGIDDLAMAYGTYDTDDTAGAHCSRAVVAWGADRGAMLTETAPVALGSVYRAGLAVGDLDCDGRNELVVGGSESADAADRTVAVYVWNGAGFDRLASASVDLADEFGYDYTSRPTNAANVAVGAFYGAAEGPCIYLDSIVFGYGSGGIDVLDLVPWYTMALGTPISYSEWGARAADFTGSGQDVIGVNFHTGRIVNDQFLSFAALSGSGDDRKVQKLYSIETSTGKNASVFGTRAVPFCLPNTDDDSIVLRYTGEHYYTYADPEVLAVLASPPYFSDLANGDDDSQMIESKTSYSASRGSGSGQTHSNSLSVGVYTSWEQSFSILGVEIAHAEAEAAINNTFTWQTQKSGSIEYEIEYATMAGMDAVVLYALPIETYVYEAAMPGGTRQTMTVNKPYEPSVRTISAADYAGIQRVYSDILPDVSGVLTHTVGDPGSYAADVSALPDGRALTLVCDGSFAAVGQGSQNTITQTIAMTSEEERSFTYDLGVETKAGAGAGGVTVGVTAGYSHGAGMVHVTTAGSAYSGELNGLPTQAERYGYSFGWKLVGYLYQGKYPVVTYLVNSVSQPPLLPESFGANEEQTTSSSIALEWDYPGNAAGFVLYRYFQSPSSSGYYQIASVSGGDYLEVRDGVKHYRYVDSGLAADTGYAYRIQTIGLSQPNTSIPSEALNTCTKPETGAPLVAVSEDRLAAYPDVRVSTTAYIENSDEFGGARVYYQWQKQSGRAWGDVSGETAATLTFRYPDRGVEGVYRCKVSALAGLSLVTAYSPEVTVTFAQRESRLTDLAVSGKTLTAKVAAVGTTSSPSGTVNFILTAAGGAETVYTAEVGPDGTASAAIDPAAAIYKVTATYSGSKVFLPASCDPKTPVFYAEGVAGGSYVDVKDSYVYGEKFDFVKYTVAGGSVTAEPFVPEKDAWYYVHVLSEAAQQRFYDGYAGCVSIYRWNFDDGHNYTVHITARLLTVTGLPETYTISIDDDRAQAESALLAQLAVDGVVEPWDGEALGPANRKIRVQKGNGTWVDLTSDSIAPGVYTMAAVFTGQNPTANYDLTRTTGKLIVLGASYPVSAAAGTGQDTFGSVAVTYPAGAASAAVGQTVIFKATPNPGYVVDYWMQSSPSGNGGWNRLTDKDGMETLTMTQTADGLNLRVFFKAKNSTLTVGALPENAGTIAADSPYFKSGNVFNPGACITFTANAADGWHFTGWEYYEDGQTAVYGSEDTYTVVMPANSVKLYARFERDTYALTLGEGLAAESGGAAVADLTAIPGDTVVTVKTAAGYVLNDDANWTRDGAPLDPQPEGEYTFSMTADTSVSASVTAQMFTVSLSAEGITGGSAALTGPDAEGRAAAGTAVTFTAAPARGFEFAGWQDADGKIVSRDARYTFKVSGDVALAPAFAAQTGKTVTLGGNIDWAIDGAYTASTAREKTFSYSDLPGSVSVTLQPVTYFTVSMPEDSGLWADADGECSSTTDETTGRKVARIGAGSTVTIHYTDPYANTYVKSWHVENAAGETVLDCATVREVLILEDLNEDLFVTAETDDIENLAFFEITGETPAICSVTISGTYEKVEAPNTSLRKITYARGSAVTLTVSLEPGWEEHVWIRGVTFGDLALSETNGVWSGTIESLQGPAEFRVDTERYYVLSFDLNYDQAPTLPDVRADKNGRVESLPAPTREGYTFLGWFDNAADGSGEQKTAESVFTGAGGTLYAHWKENPASGGETGGGTGGGSGGAPGGIVLPAPDEPLHFADVDPDAYYAAAVAWAVENGITNGTTDTTFSPQDTCTRAQMVTFLWRANGRPDAAESGIFRDVPDGCYYEPAVAWALERGITNGLTADEFGSGRTVTRAQMVVFLWRLAGRPAVDAELPFADVPADSWCADAVRWASSIGLTEGTSKTTFSPNAPCRRGQIVTFLYRFLN